MIFLLFLGHHLPKNRCVSWGPWTGKHNMVRRLYINEATLLCGQFLCHQRSWETYRDRSCDRRRSRRRRRCRCWRRHRRRRPIFRLKYLQNYKSYLAQIWNVI